jgi:Aromatic amino acid lyase
MVQLLRFLAFIHGGHTRCIPLTLRPQPQRTIKLDDGPLRIEDIIDIAEGSARVVLSDSHEFCAGIARGADFLDRLLCEEGTFYGVTTGYGDSCTVTVLLCHNFARTICLYVFESVKSTG